MQLLKRHYPNSSTLQVATALDKFTDEAIAIKIYPRSLVLTDTFLAKSVKNAKDFLKDDYMLKQPCPLAAK